MTLAGCSSSSSREVVEKDGGSGGSAGASACQKHGDHDVGTPSTAGLINGKPCDKGSQCQSGYCVENVCCNSECQFADCVSCVVPNSEGSCSLAKQGTNPRCTCAAGCPGSGNSCL